MKLARQFSGPSEGRSKKSFIITFALLLAVRWRFWLGV
jgi:hypothetical protein